VKWAYSQSSLLHNDVTQGFIFQTAAVFSKAQKKKKEVVFYKRE
jgi:hypothetical protein